MELGGISNYIAKFEIDDLIRDRKVFKSITLDAKFRVVSRYNLFRTLTDKFYQKKIQIMEIG
jgi:hypothetical protein